MPLFSIVTITYNSCRYLEETLKSVLSQDFSDIEYLIVDGGSTDGTLDIIKSYAALDRRIRWISEPDKGIADAMNKGIRMASGEVVAHLHADDTYLDGTLSAVADRFAEQADTRWLTGRIRCVNTTGENLYTTALKNSYDLPDILYGNIISHPATFIRRSLFDEIGIFNTKYRYSMDYDLWLRISFSESPAVIDRVLATFRVHPDSLSSANILAALDEEHSIRRQNWGVLSTGSRLAAELRYRREKLLIRLGLNNFRKKFIQKFRFILRSSGK